MISENWKEDSNGSTTANKINKVTRKYGTRCNKLYVLNMKYVTEQNFLMLLQFRIAGGGAHSKITGQETLWELTGCRRSDTDTINPVVRSPLALKRGLADGGVLLVSAPVYLLAFLMVNICSDMTLNPTSGEPRSLRSWIPGAGMERTCKRRTESAQLASGFVNFSLQLTSLNAVKCEIYKFLCSNRRGNTFDNHTTLTGNSAERFSILKCSLKQLCNVFLAGWMHRFARRKSISLSSWFKVTQGDGFGQVEKCCFSSRQQVVQTQGHWTVRY